MACLLALGAGALIPSSVSAQAGGPVAIDDLGNPPTVAAPYPARNRVDPPRPIVRTVEVRLNDLAPAAPHDLDILLTAPSGKSAVLMSDAGGGSPANVDLTFADGATSNVPSPLASGTYRLTDIDTDPFPDLFPAPAPPGPFAAALSGFRGEVARGDWRLFVVDDNAGGSGALQSWSLSVTSRRALRFKSEPSPPASERAGEARFVIGRRIIRAGSGMGPAALRYETVAQKATDQSAAAKPGRDYKHVEGKVNFAAGQQEATVTVPILQDRSLEDREAVGLRIFDSEGDIALRSQDATVVLGTTITDDEPALKRPALRARRVQRALRRRGVVFRVRSNVDASLFATGRIVVPGRSRAIKLRRALAPAPAGLGFRMKLRLSAKGRRILRRALRGRRRPVARIRVEAVAESGAKSEAARRVRLKR